MAVGETGLDYYWTDAAAGACSEDSFRAHIDIAKRTGKALMIHDRDAHEDVLRILASEGAPEQVDVPLLLRRRGRWPGGAPTPAT